jgi:hypothetical protein
MRLNRYGNRLLRSVKVEQRTAFVNADVYGNLHRVPDLAQFQRERFKNITVLIAPGWDSLPSQVSEVIAALLRQLLATVDDKVNLRLGGRFLRLSATKCQVIIPVQDHSFSFFVDG